MQIPGALLIQQCQVHLHERLGASFAAHTGVGPRRVQTHLGAASQHRPVDLVAVRHCQSVRNRRRPVEALRRCVERFRRVAEHRYHVSGAVDGQQRSARA